jgi:hypothetical protein
MAESGQRFYVRSDGIEGSPLPGKYCIVGPEYSRMYSWIDSWIESWIES